MKRNRAMLAVSMFLYLIQALPSEEKTGLLHIYRVDSYLGEIAFFINDYPVAQLRSKETTTIEVEEGEILLHSRIGFNDAYCKMTIAEKSEYYICYSVAMEFLRSISRLNLVGGPDTILTVQNSKYRSPSAKLFLQKMSKVKPSEVDLAVIEEKEKAKLTGDISIGAFYDRIGLFFWDSGFHALDSYGVDLTMSYLTGKLFFRSKMKVARALRSEPVKIAGLELALEGDEVAFNLETLIGQGASYSFGDALAMAGAGFHLLLESSGGESDSVFGLGMTGIVDIPIVEKLSFMVSIDLSYDFSFTVFFGKALIQAMGGDLYLSAFMPSMSVDAGIALRL